LVEWDELERMWLADQHAEMAEYSGDVSLEFNTHRRYVERSMLGKSDEECRTWIYRSIISRRLNRIRNLVSLRGARYEGCRLKNFVTDTEAQQKAAETLRLFGKSMDDHCEAGRGLILFGPKGTGKDHLAMALAFRAIIQFGLDVEWTNGMDLFGRFRDAMDDKDTSEHDLIREYARRQILYISDPVPPVGNLTEFQASVLFRILDARYSSMKPTWITVNVTSAVELDARIGAQNGDRLRDGATAIFCNWPSYRKAVQ
jgi:DNA replication protein DnaC